MLVWLAGHDSAWLAVSVIVTFAILLNALHASTANVLRPDLISFSANWEQTAI